MSFLEQVTIGIPVYNEGNFIRDTLLSAIKQNCNIIISDNGSTDLTKSICEEFENQYPNVLYIRQEKNLGMFLIKLKPHIFYGWAVMISLVINLWLMRYQY